MKIRFGWAWVAACEWELEGGDVDCVSVVAAIGGYRGSFAVGRLFGSMLSVLMVVPLFQSLCLGSALFHGRTSIRFVISFKSRCRCHGWARSCSHFGFKRDSLGRLGRIQ